jgi:hypothetical protein
MILQIAKHYGQNDDANELVDECFTYNRSVGTDKYVFNDPKAVTQQVCAKNKRYWLVNTSLIQNKYSSIMLEIAFVISGVA